MPALADHMPQLDISKNVLLEWGRKWLSNINDETGNEKKTNAFDRRQSVNFAGFLDRAFADAIAIMLGDIPVENAIHNSLIPPNSNCVEIGNVRIIGGVRPQNYDAVYRPDGPRIVFDSKTLNDTDSVRKNWQNMINDLATEATTIHTRFPYAISVFMVVIPRPALHEKQQADIIRTLERLGTRKNVLNQNHLAEGVSLIVWNPENGEIENDIPSRESILRIEKLPELIYPQYVERYKGLPPHNTENEE